MNILADFANRVPELYLKAKLDEKRMILATITESITINAETETITVKLRPVFEHLRLAKQSFKADLEKLDGTLQPRSERAKQALQNIRPDVNDLVDYGTRKRLLNTKIEPNFEGSKKSNVVRVTKLEPDDKNNLPYKTNAVNLIRLSEEYTEDYFNMKIALENCA